MLTLVSVKLSAVNLCAEGVVLHDVLIIVGSKETVITNETKEHWKLCVCVCTWHVHVLWHASEGLAIVTYTVLSRK